MELTKEQLRKCHRLALDDYFKWRMKYLKSFESLEDGKVRKTKETETYKQFMDEAGELAKALESELSF